MITEFDTYQDIVDDMPLYDDPILGLAGEIGEVVELIKKGRRPNKEVDIDKLQDEIGDVLWYLARLSSEYDLDLKDIATFNVEKLLKRHAEAALKNEG